VDRQSTPRQPGVAGEGESSTNPNAVKVYITVDYLHFAHEPRTPAPRICRLRRSRGFRGGARTDYAAIARRPKKSAICESFW